MTKKRILFIPIDSTGGMTPFLDTMLNLIKAGCEVMVVAAEDYFDILGALGIQYYPVRINLNEILNGNGKESGLFNTASNPIRFVLSVLKILTPVMEVYIRATIDSIEHFQPNMIVLNAASEWIVGSTAKLVADKDVVIGSLAPYAFKESVSGPPSFVPYFLINISKGANRMLHNIFGVLLNLVVIRSSLVARRVLGKRFKYIGFNSILKNSRFRIISLYDFQIGDALDDKTYIVGQITIPAKHFPVTQRIIDFLAKNQGKPILLVTFGSMPTASGDLTKKIVLALQNLDCAAIFVESWKGIKVEQIPNDDRFLIIPSGEFIGYGDLFETGQIKAIICHCGSGTTGTAIAYGIPIVPMPILTDQYYWAMICHDNGLAYRPLNINRFNESELALAVRFCLDPDTQMRSYEFAARLPEHGEAAKEAVRIIIHHL